MAKEILLYQPIYASTAADFIGQLEGNKSRDICARVYCNGGDVYATYGMIAKWNEHTAGKSMKIDGRADSSAAYMMCSSDNNECLTVSKFTFHRAAAPSYIENDKARFTDGLKASLNEVNGELRAMIERNVSADKWQEVTGVSLDDMYSLDSRIDVEINAQQAKELGFIQRVIPLTKTKQVEINALCSTIGIAAVYQVTNEKPENKTIMEIATLAELKASYPKLYEEALNTGAETERDRVMAALTYGAVDLEAVKLEIKGGKPLSQTFIAEMGQKQLSVALLKNMEDNPITVATAAPADQATAEDVARKAQQDERIARYKAANNIK